jgi:carotenoid cleavage dioxygenase
MSLSADPATRDRYFDPVPDEITADDLPVVGTLPPQLTGSICRDRDPSALVE